MAKALASGAFFLVTSFIHANAADLPVVSRGSLDQGFHLLYNLDFDQAHQVYVSWEHEHPQDPVGHQARAASGRFASAFSYRFHGRRRYSPSHGLPAASQ